MNSPLTSKERARLRAQANRLQPIQSIGNKGLTPGVVASLLEAFNTREVLKVKLQDGAPGSARDVADQIAAAIDAVEIVQTIGKVIVLYRPLSEEA